MVAAATRSVVAPYTRDVLTIVLTRHGLTERSNPEQHLGQRIDVGLSDAGREQAEALARRIGDEPFDRIVSSPLVRARETATIVAGDRPVELDHRLAAMDYGAWEGLTYEQIDAHDADYRSRWVADPASLSCPDGESASDVATRARAFLDDQLADPPAGAADDLMGTDLIMRELGGHVIEEISEH